MDKIFETNVERMNELTGIVRNHLRSDFLGESLKGFEAQLLEQLTYVVARVATVQSMKSHPGLLWYSGR